MDQIPLNQGIAEALDSLLADRLVLLAGAGLSMPAPSNLPSAAAIAASAKRKYEAIHGTTRAPLPDDIEAQAEFFFQRGELATVYFRTLVDHNAFASQPNLGHFACADLLLIRGIQAGVTTNVDTLIETAGQLLFGQIGVGIDGNGVAALPPQIAPLLKLHGCRVCDSANMVWAPGQLAAPPVSVRIANSTTWLNANLLDRDLLVVGYWTDWDYLNAILQATLGVVAPARVIVVDPVDPAVFRRKAPELFALGGRASSAFRHVQESGARFLDILRKTFSESFVRSVLHSGAADFQAVQGAPVNPACLEPPDLDNQTLWHVRRDLEGRLPNEPSKQRGPADETLLGLTLLQLRSSGAVPDGPYWALGGLRVRVLRAANKTLHAVEAQYQRETPPVVAPDIIIAVGAEAQALPMSIARAGSAGTIARGTVGRWMTRTEAMAELGL